jgi:hypothetical protein
MKQEVAFPKFLPFKVLILNSDVSSLEEAENPESYHWEWRYFKRTCATHQDYTCHQCSSKILQSEEYYLERYPKWLNNKIRDTKFDNIKICHQCASKLES